MATYAKFVRGAYTSYKSEYATDGTIFFCTDATHPVIIANGIEVGINQDTIEKIIDGVKNVASTTNSDGSIKITITYFKSTTPATEIVIPVATDTVTGLMTAADHAKLTKVNAAVFGDGEGDGETIDDRIEDAVGDLKDEILGDATTFTDLGKVEDAIEAMDLTEVTGVVTKLSQTDGKVSAEAVAVGNGLKKTATALEVSIAEADKILSTSSNGLLSTLSLKFVKAADNTADGANKGKAVIQLVGKDNTLVSEIDATDLVMDGVLDKVELEGSELTFTWNSAANKEDTTIDLANYIKAYTAGAGLALTGQAFSVKLKAEGEKYLELTSGGELASKGIDTAISTAVAAETSRAEGAESALEERIEDLEEAVGEDSVEDQITEALGELTLAEQGGTGKYVKSVKQENGKVTATAADLNDAAVTLTATGFTGNTVKAAVEELLAMWEWHEA